MPSNAMHYLIRVFSHWVAFLKRKKFPFFKQLDSADCGPACLKMISKFYGKDHSLDDLRQLSHTTRLGVSMLGIIEAAQNIGFRTEGVRISFGALKKDGNLPCIVYWGQNHFVVLYFIKKKIYVADPSVGKIKYSKEEFLRGFVTHDEAGFLLFLRPTPKFFELLSKEEKKFSDLIILFSYLRKYSRFFLQLFLGVIGATAMLLISPFLMQALVDNGIANKSIGFVYLIFMAQVILFIGSSSIEMVRGWILLHIGTRVNISIVSDFLMKLLRLPVTFFNSKLMGDILQRIEDNNRIEKALTSTVVDLLFSFLNIFIFGFVLLSYSILIFAIFIAGSTISTLCTLILLNRRKLLDIRRFNQQSLSRGKLIHIIEGIEDIKASNSDQQQRWEWEGIQARLFRINIKSLGLAQVQQFGSSAITQVKNIVISIFAAKAVIAGNITLGAMMAIMFIIGQLNMPIVQLLNSILVLQDAKIGFERINEIYSKKDEDALDGKKLIDIPDNSDIILKGVSFSYDRSSYNLIIRDLSLTISGGKVTAIIGASGSGKTTLMKLLLKFYKPQEGTISLGDIDLADFDSSSWRERCGVVFQDGYLFSDTIAGNITLGKPDSDYDKIRNALRIADIYEFVNEFLPMKYLTKIGEGGLKLSTGQSQRILLARAIYKDPAYLFLDEATSYLDGNSEKKIMDNLTNFFKGKTVLIIAHRLSTVKNADKIAVLNKGRIIEEGTHEGLVKESKYYYNLIKNQLELGK
jgi:ATP-binding cassette subfamily B protein